MTEVQLRSATKSRKEDRYGFFRSEAFYSLLVFYAIVFVIVLTLMLSDEPIWATIRL